jgi:hypothetical protein
MSPTVTFTGFLFGKAPLWASRSSGVISVRTPGPSSGWAAASIGARARMMAARTRITGR